MAFEKVACAARGWKHSVRSIPHHIVGVVDAMYIATGKPIRFAKIPASNCQSFRWNGNNQRHRSHRQLPVSRQ